MLSAVLFFFIYIHIEPHFLTVRHLEIAVPEECREFDGKKIVFFSDIHHGPDFSVKRIKNLVKTVNELNPDIILAGGDYVSGSAYIEECFGELKELKAPLGKFGVLGNHDHWDDAIKTRECMKNSGIKNIDNSSEWIESGGARIKIGGVGDLWTDFQDVEKTSSGTTEKDFVILISHNPDYAEKLGEAGGVIDLMLSGHTHGGQGTFFGLYAPVLPSAFGQKYRSGIAYKGRTQVIVSKGVGNIRPAWRFCCPPDILALTLKAPDKKTIR